MHQISITDLIAQLAGATMYVNDSGGLGPMIDYRNVVVSLISITTGKPAVDVQTELTAASTKHYADLLRNHNSNIRSELNPFVPHTRSTE
jgi:hypothetical protein